MKAKPLTLLVAFFIALQILLLIKTPILRWDEAVYVAMGKYLFSFGTSGLWEQLRPIITPMIYGFFWKIGADPIFFGHIIAIVFSTFFLIVTAYLGTSLFDERTGIIATLMIVITPSFFYHSNTLLTDIPAAALSLAALLYCLRSRPIFAGFLVGVATLIRFPAALAFISMIIISIDDTKRRKDILALSIAFFVVLIPFLLFNIGMYHTEYSIIASAFHPFALSSQSQNNLAESQPFYYYIQILAFPTIWFLFSIVGFMHLPKKRMYIRYALIYLTTHFIYYSIIINKQDRFVFTFLPIIAIFSAHGIIIMWKIRWVRVFLVLGICIGLILTVNIGGHFVSWRLNPSDLNYTLFLNFAQEYPYSIFLTSNPIPAAYSDARFLTYYHNVEIGERDFSAFINQSDFVIFSKEAYYCPPANLTCLQHLSTLQTMANSSGTQVLGLTHEGRTYSIYKHLHTR
ncbi:MAG: glycosyltransferase family 39 protein [Nanoarchaeota archaeon]